MSPTAVFGHRARTEIEKESTQTLATYEGEKDLEKPKGELDGALGLIFMHAS